MPPSLVLINPWIYDFAAFDLWSKPLGLLSLAGYLRHHGFHVHLIDCLDRHPAEAQGHGPMKGLRIGPYGTGKYRREPVPRPPALRHVRRPYSRYGISPARFMAALQATPRPSAFLVTSLMTYWYPGVTEVIRLLKAAVPRTPVILGGIYARLCHEHALYHTGADLVFTESDPQIILQILKTQGISPSLPQSLNPRGGESKGAWGRTPGDISHGSPVCSPYPAFDLLGKIPYVCLLTSTGCPYQCRYCASPFLNPVHRRKGPTQMMEEILYWHRHYGVTDFAFYDDALLMRFETHLGPVLEEIIRQGLGLRFHTPNAVHVKEVKRETARLMFRAGFQTLRLGLETSDDSMHKTLDEKITPGDFERAVGHLSEAGFAPHQLGAYILMGLPGQPVHSVDSTLDFLASRGVTPYLSEYSPIPHTGLWEEALHHSDYDLASEPLFHNNTLLPCWDEGQRRNVPRLKARVLAIRRDLNPS